MNTMLGWLGRAVAVVSTGASTTRNGKSAVITRQFQARLFITTSTGAILQRENMRSYKGRIAVSMWRGYQVRLLVPITHTVPNALRSTGFDCQPPTGPT